MVRGDSAPQQGVLGVDLEKGEMPISPPARKIRELQELPEDSPAGRRTATVREVLVLGENQRHLT